MTFKEAKDKAAKEQGFRDWDHLLAWCNPPGNKNVGTGKLHYVYELAADLYSKDPVKLIADDMHNMTEQFGEMNARLDISVKNSRQIIKDLDEHRTFKDYVLQLYILIVFAITAAAFYCGKYIGSHDEKVKAQKEKCTGYTILDADRVVTCHGDTLDYDWHPKPLSDADLRHTRRLIEEAKRDADKIRNFGTGSDISEP
jgi:hypothetical protein